MLRHFERETDVETKLTRGRGCRLLGNELNSSLLTGPDLRWPALTVMRSLFHKKHVDCLDDHLDLVSHLEIQVFERIDRHD